jgi:hypothetical protein
MVEWLNNLLALVRFAWEKNLKDQNNKVLLPINKKGKGKKE